MDAILFKPTKGDKIVFTKDAVVGYHRKVHKGQKGEVTSIYSEGDTLCTVRPENHKSAIIGVPIELLEKDISGIVAFPFVNSQPM